MCVLYDTYAHTHKQLKFKIPELPDESVALWQLQQLQEKVHPLLDALAAHPVQDTKVVHRLLGSEFTIESQLLPNCMYV